MGPIWVLSAPDGPHVGPVNLAIREYFWFLIANDRWMRMDWRWKWSSTRLKHLAPSQYPKRRLIVRSREVSKPWYWYFKLSYRFEIWQAHRQQCCRSACFQSDRTILNTNLATSRLYEILRKYVFLDIETGPWFPVWSTKGSYRQGNSLMRLRFPLCYIPNW